MLTKKFALNLSLILLHEGFDGGGRLFGLEWTMQRNDQLPEENQTGGNDFFAGHDTCNCNASIL